jgi:peptide/nickel transport system permease protein
MGNRRSKETVNEAGAIQTFKRVGKYSLYRGLSIIAALLIGVYLCVLAVNFGGFIDEIFNDIIENEIKDFAIFGDHSGETYEETTEKINQYREQLREMYGLNEPFINRNLRWYWHAITFDWGDQVALDDDGNFLFGGVIPVKQMVLDYLPRSLLLFGAANLTTFTIGIFIALRVSRKPNSWINKLISALTPLFTAPSWVYGIILLVILPWSVISYPRNALIDPNYEFTVLEQAGIVLKRLAWPVAATFLSMFIQLIFTWRTFFTLNAAENYVELATAMGLHPRKVERKYILRPTLLPVLTNFSMLLLSFWQSSIALEFLFNWPGIGFLFIRAIWFLHRNTIIGIVVTFAVLIAITVFVLEFLYALVDPRVRVAGKQTRKTMRRNKLSRFRNWFTKRGSKKAPAPPQSQSRRSSKQPRPAGHKRKIAFNSIGIQQSALIRSLTQTAKSPLAVSSLTVIFGLIIIAIVIVIKIPQNKAIELWREQREDTWRTPELAQPAWTNLFRKEKLAETLYITEEDPAIVKTESISSDTAWTKDFLISFDYQAASLPQDIKIKIQADYEEKRPFIQINIFTPDGRKLELAGFTSTSETLYSIGDRIVAEVSTANRSYAGSPMVPLFTDPDDESQTVITGEYQVQVTASTFEEASDISIEMAMLGDVYGLSGTDYDKHDLSVPLLWGLPVALIFGLAGAVLTSVTTMMIAATGTWFGGWADSLVQRITEINIMLPALPIAMTIFYSVSKSIWVILGVMVLLNIFSSEIKNYRAAFLQIKDMPYIEAAQAYGASNFHIIRHYLIPKIYPLLLPRLVFMVPAYVYLEATLAYLGVSGIFIPTWGKMIFEGLWYRDSPYWIAQPIILLVLTGTAFTMLGVALEKQLNPTLQDI